MCGTLHAYIAVCIFTDSFCSADIVCSEVPQNVSVLEGNAAKIVVTCSGSLDFNFTLFLTAIDGSAVGECWLSSLLQQFP